MSDIDTVVMDSLKALDPNRPIREADIGCPLARPLPVCSFKPYDALSWASGGQ